MRRLVIFLFLISICYGTPFYLLEVQGDVYTSHQLPVTDSTLDIGSTSYFWRYIYGDILTDGTFIVTNGDITADSLRVKSPWIDVTHPDFGATGDGSTDDTAAIQAAIDAAESSGKPLYIPAGTYKVTSTLIINQSGFRLKGEGSLTRIHGQDIGDYIFLIGGNQEEHIYIGNITLSALGTTTGCLKLLTAHYNLLDNIECYGTGAGDNQIGILIDGTTSGFWNKLQNPFCRSLGTGLKIVNTANAVVVINGTFRSSDIGIDVDSGDKFTMVGGFIEAWTTTGIRFNDKWGSLHGVRFEETTAGLACVTLTASSVKTSIIGCWLNAPVTIDDSSNGKYIRIDSDLIRFDYKPGSSFKVTIGNEVIINARYGLDLRAYPSAAYGVTISAMNGGGSFRELVRAQNVAAGEPNLLLVEDYGKVGIGIPDPLADKLHVRGATFPPTILERVTGQTNIPIGAVALKITSFGDMADGFGGGFIFQLQDEAGVANNVAAIHAVRDGGDALGALEFRTGGISSTTMFLESGGNVGVGTTNPTAKLDINSDIFRLRTAKTPASASATGNEGDHAWDGDYIYICVATDTWKRAAITTWAVVVENVIYAGENVIFAAEQVVYP